MSENTEMTGDVLLERMGVGTRKSYYAGRGAKLADLNGNNLIRAYKILRDEVSQEAADQFATTVNAIRELSACNFIDAMRRLHANGWQFDQSVLQPGVEYDDMSSHAEALGIAATAWHGMRYRDETGSIKWYFREELKKLHEENTEQ